MGMDGVELVIEAEEHFGIKITDEEAGGVLTVGHLYELILKKSGRRPAPEAPCLSAATFRRLRACIVSSIDPAAKRLRPSDKIAAVMPRNNCRLPWQQLHDALQLDLPSLMRPSWLTTMIHVASIAFGGAFFAAALLTPLHLLSVIIGVATGMAAYALLMKVTEPWTVQIRPSCVTFGDLTHALMAQNFEKLRAARANPSAPADWQESIWLEVVALVSEQLGVAPELVTRNASFVNDLGMD